jgi:hypothetical protein
VLHITLEDPIEEVENRLDASIAGVAKNALVNFPIRLRKRLRKARTILKGKIRLVDGTEGGWTLAKIEQTWEELRQDGFIADAIVIDYDDELESPIQYKGDSAARMKSADIYRSLRKLAARLNIIVWTAAQGTRASEGHKIISGRDVAEDISKIRKVTLCIGIGKIDEYEDRKHLYVTRHRLDRSRFGVDICTDYGAGLFYDVEATNRLRAEERRR